MGLKIVLEGPDGSGKETQAILLNEYLKEKSIKVSFPNYSNISAMGIRHYLETGLLDLKDKKSLMDFYKYVASLYTVNRYETFNTIYETYDKTLMDLINDSNKIFIFDRYTTSNMLHMGANIESEEEREEFLKWLLYNEYEVYKIPKPDIVFYLSVPTSVSLSNISSRRIINKDDENDIHETLHHLNKVYNLKDKLIKDYNWINIDCVDENGKMYSKEIIHQKIIDKIKELTDLNL